MIHSPCSMDHGLWIMDHLKPEFGRDIRNGSSTSSHTAPWTGALTSKVRKRFNQPRIFSSLGSGS
jgi:hypothetical protein